MLGSLNMTPMAITFNCFDWKLAPISPVAIICGTDLEYATLTLLKLRSYIWHSESLKLRFMAYSDRVQAFFFDRRLRRERLRCAGIYR